MFVNTSHRICHSVAWSGRRVHFRATCLSGVNALLPVTASRLLVLVLAGELTVSHLARIGIRNNLIPPVTAVIGFHTCSHQLGGGFLERMREFLQIKGTLCDLVRGLLQGIKGIPWGILTSLQLGLTTAHFQRRLLQGVGILGQQFFDLFQRPGLGFDQGHILIGFVKNLRIVGNTLHQAADTLVDQYRPLFQRGNFRLQGVDALFKIEDFLDERSFLLLQLPGFQRPGIGRRRRRDLGDALGQ